MCIASFVQGVRSGAAAGGQGVEPAPASGACQPFLPFDSPAFFEQLSAQLLETTQEQSRLNEAVGCSASAALLVGCSSQRRSAAPREVRCDVPVAGSGVLTKTKLCKFFARGQCTHGSACTFAHGRRELQAQPDLYRTEMCFDFTNTGRCHYGKDCRYAHSQEELRHPNRTQSEAAPQAPGPRGPRHQERWGNGEGIHRQGSDKSSLTHRLEAIQQEAVRLRAQLEALQGIVCTPDAGNQLEIDKVSPGATSGETTAWAWTPEGSCGSKLSDVSSGAESEVGLASTGFASDSSRRGPKIEIDTDLSADCALVVERTFFSLRPLTPSSQSRRAKSMPAHCHSDSLHEQ